MQVTRRHECSTGREGVLHMITFSNYSQMKKAMKTKKIKNSVTAKPVLKWQTGDYKRHSSFSFILPYQFLLLSKLMDITPEDIIRDFANNLDCGSWDREGKDLAKEHLINYFIACGYGQQYYTVDDIRLMFKEMDALGRLFPKNSNKMKLVKLYSKWRNKHQK
jgi:hypothetical protein